MACLCIKNRQLHTAVAFPVSCSYAMLLLYVCLQLLAAGGVCVLVAVGSSSSSLVVEMV